MSGNNNNGYAESKRLLLGVGDLYISGTFVGNLKGKVELKITRKYAFQRAGMNMADQKGEVTDEEVTLDAEICDFKLSQLRRALGINQAIDTTTAKSVLKKEQLKLSGVANTALGQTPSPLSVKLYSLDRKTTYVSGTDYKISSAGIERQSAASVIPSPSYVIAEYYYSDSTPNSLRFGGESSPVPTFQLDYVHMDSAGKNWMITLFKAMTHTSFAIAFTEAMKGNYTTYNISFKALIDTTKPEGQNLLEVIEEAPTA